MHYTRVIICLHCMQEYENKIDELDTLHKQRKVSLILETMNCSSGVTVSLLFFIKSLKYVGI